MPPFPYVKRHSRIPVEQRGLIKLRSQRTGSRHQDPLMDRMVAVTDPDQPHVTCTSNDMSSQTKKAKMLAEAKKKQTAPAEAKGPEPPE